jgi:hypothetical protein
MTAAIREALAAETATVLDLVVAKVLALEDAQAARDARISALESKIALLEERRYCGVWREGAYQPGNEVTHGGTRWHCWEQTSARPGESKAWQMTGKTRGRDDH